MLRGLDIISAKCDITWVDLTVVLSSGVVLRDKQETRAMTRPHVSTTMRGIPRVQYHRVATVLTLPGKPNTECNERDAVATLMCAIVTATILTARVISHTEGFEVGVRVCLMRGTSQPHRVSNNTTKHCIILVCGILGYWKYNVYNCDPQGAMMRFSADEPPVGCIHGTHTR